MTTNTSEPRRPRWQALLFPEPHRRVPGERLLRTVLRTLHIASMAVFLGGHVFDVAKAELVGPLIWTVATGLLIVFLEIYGSLNWLCEVRGLATVLKVGVMCLVPVFWAQRVWLLMTVLAIGSLSSHAPGAIRYFSVRTGRTGERKSG